MGSYTLIVREIVAAKREFEELAFYHERRNSNKEAHALARSAIRDEQGRRLWLDGPPEGLCIPMIVEV